MFGAKFKVLVITCCIELESCFELTSSCEKDIRNGRRIRHRGGQLWESESVWLLLEIGHAYCFTNKR